MNIHLAKVWTAIDKQSIIWMSDLSDKIKRCFICFRVNITTMHDMATVKMPWEQARWETHWNATSYTERNLEATLLEAIAVRPHTSQL